MVLNKFRGFLAVVALCLGFGFLAAGTATADGSGSTIQHDGGGDSFTPPYGINP